MSLDDEHPTQYFGPDAEVWVSPDGRTVQLSPAEANRYRDSFAQVGWRKSAAKPLVFGENTVTWEHPNGTTYTLTPGQKDAIDKTKALFAGERCESAPFPMEEKDYYPSIEKEGLRALTVNGEIWVPRRQQHTEQLDALSGMVEWRNHWEARALSAERHRFHLAAARAVTVPAGLAGWIYALTIVGWR